MTNTDFSTALTQLAEHVCTNPPPDDAPHPELDNVLTTVQWLRQHPQQARTLIGDLTHGY